MKPYKKLLLVLFFLSATAISVFAQNTYIDPTVTLALKLYSDNLKKEQNKMVEQQTKLQRAQGWVASQVLLANKIQDKVYKGLSTVSGFMSNSLQAKSIYDNLERCKMYSDRISKVVREHPQYAVFGAKATSESYETILEIISEVNETLKGGTNNLATAGDRYRMLSRLEDKTALLKIQLLGIALAIERAVNVGFWQSINPFQGYINTDKSIVENIFHKYKILTY
ncbi:hypothetical protein [Riemerella columbipharyngis]|uniref:Type IV pili methyl-accepting chemotaxis transducer N-term n=1 Tax=Riemerella columbipharyngis TaxID=1071918 RepID=A0A1G6ZAT2_9FLAO|nr:hypothetical protein [Riemerella columbipharyngis]SDD99789.1 hypothetical protein SAMN05421544_10225 [Riemerella columbipharyngis]